MSKIKETKVYGFIKGHPILEMILQIGVVLLAAICFIPFSSRKIIELISLIRNSTQYGYYEDMGIPEIVAYIWMFLIMMILGYKGVYQKAKVNFRTEWILGFVLVALGTLVGSSAFMDGVIKLGGIRNKSEVILWGLICFIFVGLYEELMCRGLLLNICLNHFPQNTFGMWLAVILSSLIFGLMHFTNFFMAGASLRGVIIQVIYAVEVGILFAAIYIRTGSLLWCSFLHGFIDFTFSIYSIFYETTTLTDNISRGKWIFDIKYIPAVILGIIFLRKGYASTTGIEDNGKVSKIFFWVTIIAVIVTIIGMIGFYVYVDSLSVREFIEFKKNFHVTY